MSLRKSVLVLFLISLICLANQARAQTSQYPPYPAGMRLVVGGSGVYARSIPSLTGNCGTGEGHPCAAADVIPPGVYGIVQNDPPVFEAAGWWWVRVVYDNKITGWSTGYPPYLNQLVPPQMALGFSFRVAGDYTGPTLTEGRCISDGVQSAASLNLQPQSGGTGQTGTMSCLWTTPPVGNHIAVIQAINAVGTSNSTEFQFAVTMQAVPQPPNAPVNLRIAPTTVTVVARETEKKGK
jgi:hypothetical protein